MLLDVGVVVVCRTEESGRALTFLICIQGVGLWLEFRVFLKGISSFNLLLILFTVLKAGMLVYFGFTFILSGLTKSYVVIPSWSLKCSCWIFLQLSARFLFSSIADLRDLLLRDGQRITTTVRLLLCHY